MSCVRSCGQGEYRRTGHKLLVRVALNLVEAECLHHEGVLYSEIPDRLRVARVDVLMPRPQWDAKEISFFPFNTLLRLVVLADCRVAAALDDIDHGFGRVSVVD